MEATAAGRAATELVRAGLLRSEDPLEFVHPVVRTAIYEDVDAGTRMSAHRRAAELLVGLGASPEQAAAHLLRCLPAGDRVVATTLRRAAGQALAQGAPEAAVAYLRRAVAEPPGEELADVLGELGSAEQLVDVAAAVEHLTQAIALTADPIRRTELALEQSKVLWLAARPAEAVAVLRAELAQLGSTSSDLRDRVLADLVGGAMWEPDLQQIAAEHIAGVREDELPGGIRAFPSGRGTEVIYWLPEHHALAFGDAILGARDGGVRLCPASWLPTGTDHAGLRAQLRPLLDLPAERLLVSHGEPVRSNGRAALERALRA